jgi:hypothetical protein
VLQFSEKLDFKRFLWYNHAMETATISKTEYDNLLAENAELKSQIQWLMEQLKLSKSRRFAPSSEKSDYSQLNLFNEIETTADVSVSEPPLVEIEKHYRKKKRSATDRLPPDSSWEVRCIGRSKNGIGRESCCRGRPCRTG